VAFRRAASPLSKTALLLCHIFIAMSIAQMTEAIPCRQTCRLAENISIAAFDKSILSDSRHFEKSISAAAAAGP